MSDDLTFVPINIAYLALLQHQYESCALCETPRSISPLEIDHDHFTGELRGLLCHACNMAERFRDTPALQAYRDRPPTLQLGMVAIYHNQFGAARPDRAILPHRTRRRLNEREVADVVLEWRRTGEPVYRPEWMPEQVDA